MSENSGIEWTKNTFNPWWGCVHVSPGCVNCYAETWAKRTGHGGTWGAKGDRRFFSEKHWAEPLVWNRKAEGEGVPTLVFCASMADVFEDHPALPAERDRLWDLIEQTPWLIWQLLTKRPENVSRMVPWGDAWPSNIWLGTSVEDQRRADERIPVLAAVPAITRFLSCEPLVGPVDLSRHLGVEWMDTLEGYGHEMFAGLNGDVGGGLHWVIAGGESGAKARPMGVEWVRALLDQCAAADVPIFVKQLGTHPTEFGAPLVLKDKKGGKPGEWPADLRVRQMPPIAVPRAPSTSPSPAASP